MHFHPVGNGLADGTFSRSLGGEGKLPDKRKKLMSVSNLIGRFQSPVQRLQHDWLH